MADTYLSRNRAKAAPDRLRSLLHAVRIATRDGAWTEALRLIDAAERTAPGLTTVALLHAKLLERLRRPAEGLLRLEGHTSPPALLLRIELLCALGDRAGCVAECSAFVHRFAVDGIPGIAATFDRACDTFDLPGWVAVHASLRVVARLRGGGGWTEQAIVPGRSGGQPLELHDQDGRLLLGAPLPWPPDFRAGGWVICDGRTLSGEVRLDWAPYLPRALILRSAAHGTQTIALPANQGDAEGLRSFSVVLGEQAEDLPLHVALACPDGTEAALAGSPVMRHDILLPSLLPSRPRRREASSAAARPIDVIVPVHGRRAEALRCLDSVLASVDPARTRVIVVDDASHDPELAQALRERSSDDGLVLLENPSNLGFAASVNRALACSNESDVVLLNSDCVVFGDWLERLVAAAQRDDVATVTPMGRAASIVSYPGGPDGETTAGAAAVTASRALDALAARVNRGQTVDIPVGVGFCMLIRRACIEQVGSFDAERFLRGYGEENDFCMRARQLGWRHVAATDIYVHHEGGSSFGEQRTLWMARNRRILQARHPGYETLVNQFLAQDPLARSRRALDFARLQALRDSAEGEVILMLGLGLPGGVQRHLRGRQQALQQRQGLGIVLQADSETADRVRLEVAGQSFADLYFDWPVDQPALYDCLRQLAVTGIELHHFLDLPAELVDHCRTLGVPYRAFLHDHAWLCPRISLTGGELRYCGEPTLADCERCIERHGSALEPGLGVGELRARSQRWLAGAERVVAPVRDVRLRFERHFPGLAVQVAAWESPAAPRGYATPPRRDRVRVALIGALSTQKGHQVLLACAREAARQDLPIEFALIGYSEDDASLLDTGRVFITGPYQDSEVEALILREECQLAWFPSVSPETWCYALSHAMALGMPVVGFDLGAIGERLAAYPAGHRLPLSATPGVLLAKLLSLGGQDPARSSLVAAPVRSDAPALPGDAAPGAGEASAGSATATAGAALLARPGTTGPIHAASAQPLWLAEGVYACRVVGAALRAAGLEEGDAAESALRLPAVGIGPAPVPNPGHVDVFPAPHTLPGWLSAPGDQIIVRVAGGAATLMLNSIRPIDAEPLAIEVRRLDQLQPDPPGSSATPSLYVLLHVQYLGDLHFAHGRIGAVAAGLAIEAFVLDCRDERLGSLLEYRGVTADGFETPWLSDGLLCGSRGRGVALVGLGVRVRIAASARFVLSCRAYFRRAGWIEAGADGEWITSPYSDDAIEGLHLELHLRQG